MKLNKHYLFIFLSFIFFLVQEMQAQPVGNDSRQLPQEPNCNESIRNARLGFLRLGMSKAELEHEFPVSWKQKRFPFDYKNSALRDEYIRYEYVRVGQQRRRRRATANGNDDVIFATAVLYKDEVFGFTVQLDEWNKWKSVNNFTTYLSKKYNLPSKLWEDFSDAQSKKIDCSDYQIYVSKDQRGRMLEFYNKEVNLYILRKQLAVQPDPVSGGTGSGQGNGWGSGQGSGQQRADQNRNAEVQTGPNSGTGDAKGTRSNLITGICANGKPNTRLELLSKPRAVTNEELKALNLEGIVRLQITLGADARVKEISTISSPSVILTKKAVEAAQKITFIPAQECGNSIDTRRMIEYNFTIY